MAAIMGGRVEMKVTRRSCVNPSSPMVDPIDTRIPQLRKREGSLRSLQQWAGSLLA